MIVRKAIFAAFVLKLHPSIHSFFAKEVIERGDGSFVHISVNTGINVGLFVKNPLAMQIWRVQTSVVKSPDYFGHP